MPMLEIWKDVLGQEHQKKILQKIYLSQKIPHAFLFSGTSGAGKYFTALRFCQLLNSDTSGENKPGLTALKIANLSEPYVKFIMPLPRGKNETGDNSSLEKLSKESLDEIQSELNKKIDNPYYEIAVSNANTIKISSIREIKKFVSINYDEIKYRLIIISNAHLMNDEAQNALLKNLEEPPEGIIFILLTNNKNQLLDTIISRSWVIDFEPLQESHVIQLLKERFNIAPDLAGMIAPFANGSVTRALELLKYDFEQMKDKVINILRYSLALKFYSAQKEMTSALGDSQSVTIKLIIQMITYWLNDAQRERISFPAFYFSNNIETIQKFNRRFLKTNILSVISNLNILERSIDSNVNLNIVALSIILELSSLRY
ncbi:MAG: hypothetical protein WCJ01_08845 [Ignavibacteria bacterium]